MSGARTLLAAGGMVGFAAVLVAGLTGLPAPGAARGAAAEAIAATGVAARHATDLVAAVTFDYRGLDTIGEELVLLAATAGVSLVLRPLRGERLRMARAARTLAPLPSAATRWGARQAGALAAVLALALAAHGHLTPGGGFQGGVAGGVAALCVYLSAHLPALRAEIPDHLSAMVEGAGATAFVALGFAGVLAGGAFLQDVLPLGEAGALLSAGTIPLANLAVLAAVAGAFATVLKEFLEQAVGRGRAP